MLEFVSRNRAGIKMKEKAHSVFLYSLARYYISAALIENLQAGDGEQVLSHQSCLATNKVSLYT